MVLEIDIRDLQLHLHLTVGFSTGLGRAWCIAYFACVFGSARQAFVDAGVEGDRDRVQNIDLDLITGLQLVQVLGLFSELQRHLIAFRAFQHHLTVRDVDRHDFGGDMIGNNGFRQRDIRSESTEAGSGQHSSQADRLGQCGELACVTFHSGTFPVKNGSERRSTLIKRRPCR